MIPSIESAETRRTLSTEERNAIYEATGGGEAYGLAIDRAELSPVESAERHTAGPLVWKTFGKTGLFSNSTKEIVLASDGYILTPNADTSEMVEITGNEPNARLLAAAYTSYDRHFGEQAVQAAESDALGKFIDLAKRLSDWDKKWPKYHDQSGRSEREMDVICNDARALLARITKA